MTKNAIQHMIDKIILKELKENYYMHDCEIMAIFDSMCEKSEDLDEMIEMSSNSKRYNHILLQNGEGYFVAFDKMSFRMFFDDVGVPANDPIWHEYFTYGGVSHTLLDIYLFLEGVR